MPTVLQARGVHAVSDRSRLVELAQHRFPDVDVPIASTTPFSSAISDGASIVESDILPGLETLWELRADSPSASIAMQRVAMLSQRLMLLAQVLGAGDDIDIVFMIVREPKLLTADPNAITRRLFQLRIALAGRLDVSRLVERQPSLLLDETDVRCVL